MARIVPDTLGSLPNFTLPAEVLAYMLAMSSEDWNKAMAAVLALGGGSFAVAGYKALSWWDASNAKQLLLVRRDLAACKTDKEQAEADLKDVLSERAAAKERNRVEVDRLSGVVEAMRTQLAEAYKTIAERDAEIRYRDRAIEENSRRIANLGDDMAALSKAFLMYKGDARSGGI